MDFFNQFSEREKEVINLLLQGKSNKQIAVALGVTSHTVEYHLSNIYTKLGINSCSEAIIQISQFCPGSLNNPQIESQFSTVESTPNVLENHNKNQFRLSAKKTRCILLGLIITISLVTITLIISNTGRINTHISEKTLQIPAKSHTHSGLIRTVKE